MNENDTPPLSEIKPEELSLPVDFIEIEELIHDIHCYSLGSVGGTMEKQDLYELVRQRLSIADIRDVVTAVVTAIISRREAHDLRTRNLHLQGEITRLTYKAMSIEHELDIFNAHECTLEVSTDGTILEVNDFMLEHSGFSREELVGKNMRTMSSGKHSKKFWSNFWTTILSGRVWAGDVCNKKKDGTLIWLWTLVMPKTNPNGKIESFKVVRQDVSESYLLKKKLEEALEQKIDPLTKLPNHTKFLEDFQAEKERSIAILHINNMFGVNSVFGRAKGDSVIRDIGNKLQAFASENNVSIYKFEGPDFTIVFTEDTNDKCTKDLDGCVQDLYDRFNNLNICDSDTYVNISCSLGVAFDEPNIDTLLGNGYLALNESKHSRKCVIFNNQNHTSKISEDFFRILRKVREAFERDLFTVFFQEIRKNPGSIQENTARKFECLVRMADSEDMTQIIAPGVFLSIIEKVGENLTLTSCVVEKICRFMLENDGDFSINLTEDDLRTPGRVQQIYEQIQSYALKPERITFEILEGIVNLDKNILKNIEVLREYGFQIAIDDFGAGYCNFGRIPMFKANCIKIDMSLIRGIHTNEEHRNLVQFIVELAHRNKMSIVAEGVETAEEQEVLERLGVDYSQGYLFSRPSPFI